MIKKFFCWQFLLQRFKGLGNRGHHRFTRWTLARFILSSFVRKSNKLRALDENGTVIDSVSVGVTAHGIELPEYNRQRGHLPDIDIQNIVREELHTKLKDRDAKFGGLYSDCHFSIVRE